MTNQELKEALLNASPVILKLPLMSPEGTVYRFISKIIYSRDRYGKLSVSAELQDFTGKSFVQADPRYIFIKN